MSRKRKRSKASSAKKKAKLNPNRFQQTAPKDTNGLFSFDPIRRGLFLKGLLVGGVGAFFMVLPEIVFQVIGVLIVVLISNYYIGRAAKQVPRWHAVVITFLGLIVSMFIVITVGSFIMAFYQAM